MTMPTLLELNAHCTADMENGVQPPIQPTAVYSKGNSRWFCVKECMAYATLSSKTLDDFYSVLLFLHSVPEVWGKSEDLTSAKAGHKCGVSTAGPRATRDCQQGMVRWSIHMPLELSGHQDS